MLENYFIHIIIRKYISKDLCGAFSRFFNVRVLYNIFTAEEKTKLKKISSPDKVPRDISECDWSE